MSNKGKGSKIRKRFGLTKSEARKDIIMSVKLDEKKENLRHSKELKKIKKKEKRLKTKFGV